MTEARVRILFVAEAVTLAQVVRLYVLARALPADRYEVHFASARFDDRVFRGDEGFRRWPLRSLAPEEVEKRVAGGKRIYDRRTLTEYVVEEQALLAKVRPALVVGDLRLSLSISAPLAGVKHAALINAYWSPHAVRDGWPLPDHPIVKLLGESMAAKYFPLALPKVFGHFAAPVNTLRSKHGLSEIGSLPEVLLHGDHTLFPDVPRLVPTEGAPPHHHYLGPVLWSPQVALPAWWDRLDPQRPTVYVTLGSSGRVDRLPLVLEAIGALELQAIVATAGRAAPTAVPRHVHVTDFVPGEQAARRSFAVVSNGGSTTGYQALAEGRPVAGVAFNLDQYLSMQAIERTGAGVLLRSGSLTREGVMAALARLRDDPAPRAAAETLAAEFDAWSSEARFRELVARATA